MSEKKRNEWLREKLLKYFDSDDHKQQDLCNAAKVDRKVIPRLLGGSGIALGNAIPLIKFFSPKEELAANMRAFVPELADVLKDQFANDYQVSSNSLNDLIKQSQYCHDVLVYVNREEGATEEFIHDLFGRTGTRALKQLVSEGSVVESTDGVYSAVEKDTSCTDIDAIIAKHQYHLRSFDREALIHNQIGSISHSTEYASLAGVKALRLLNGFVHSLFNRLIKLPWFKGDIPVFYQTLTGPVNEYEVGKINLEEYREIDVSLDEVKG